MPVKRRLPKHREELTIAQQRFLAGEPPRPYRDPAWGSDPIENYKNGMQAVWLEQRSYGGASDPMPDGSEPPRALWDAFGLEAADRWATEHPGEMHPLQELYGPPR